MNYIGFGIIIIILYIKFKTVNKKAELKKIEFERERDILLKERNFLNTVVENTNIVVCAWDIEGNLIKFNKYAEKITGFLESEVKEANWKKTIILGWAQTEILEVMLKLKNREANIFFKNGITCKNGTLIDMEFNCSLLHDTKYNSNIIIAIGYDISEKKQVQLKLNASFMELEATQEELMATEQELAQKYNELQENQGVLKLSEERYRYMAYYDTLTGLPNRIYSEKYLNDQLVDPDASQGKIGILALDLDNFKNINDTIGHTFGNKLLVAVAELLKQLHVDKTGMFARIGGDSFMFVLPYIKGEGILKNLAENIIEILETSIIIEEHEINITSSIGITMYPRDGEDSVTLLKNADTAMYSAKEVGKNNYQFFVKEMNTSMLEKSKLEKNLRKAIKNNEFVVYYQPQINIMSGEMVGMEALVRWKSPTLGLISPMNFIPIAEETGLIIPIGEFVLRTACRKNKEWQDKGYAHKRVAVNLSAKQFKQKNLMEIIEGILEETKLEPQWLELEITESIAMEDLDYTLIVLKKLIARGICISLDDFGTGFSSLNYLKILPINILKIDKSFVDDIDKCSKEAAIARAIISMAHSMALVIVAEGVEHIAQLEFLKDQGCDKAQGFLFSKPVTEEAFEEILRGKILVDKY
ncbi:MAG: EAL domain-containing protein [Clostridiaceae bacterium]|nr:EAL domain-containing protein [Clostridiaceae bacterium]